MGAQEAAEAAARSRQEEQAKLERQERPAAEPSVHAGEPSTAGPGKFSRTSSSDESVAQAAPSRPNGISQVQCAVVFCTSSQLTWMTEVTRIVSHSAQWAAHWSASLLDGASGWILTDFRWCPAARCAEFIDPGRQRCRYMTKRMDTALPQLVMLWLPPRQTPQTPRTQPARVGAQPT